MKKQLILSLALFVTLFSFAQKKEVKMLEKAVKNNNYAEAKAMASKLESLTGSMDNKMKAKYYLNKGKAYFANGAGSNKDVMMAVESLKQVPSGSYESEVGKLKQLMENDLLTKANDLYKANKFKEASAAFYNLYNVAPEDQVYLYYAAVSAVGAQDFDSALSHYLKLKDLGYTGVETQYFATSKETGEEQPFDKATRDLYVNKLKTHINPRDGKTESKTAEITKNIALIYLEQGKNDEALAAIQEARAANPKDTALILTEANTQFKLGNKEAYATLIKEAISNDPTNKDLLFNLGVLASDAGNKEEARSYYEKAIEIDANYVNALTNLSALILSAENAIVEEMNGLGSSAKDDRRYDELRAQKDKIYKEAIPYLETVLEISEKENKSNADVARTLMNIYNAIDETTKAKALREKYGL
ncbi:tetratricopeptide repeat protein [Pontimicrobium sp. MEBiC06410]